MRKKENKTLGVADGLDFSASLEDDTPEVQPMPQAYDMPQTQRMPVRNQQPVSPVTQAAPAPQPAPPVEPVQPKPVTTQTQPKPAPKAQIKAPAAIQTIAPEPEDPDVTDYQKELKLAKSKTGQKMSRMTMAFTKRNYDYIRIESRRRGKSATEFVNEVLELYRQSPEGKAQIPDWD